MSLKEILDKLQSYVDTEMSIMAELGRDHSIDYLELDWGTAINLRILMNAHQDPRLRSCPRFGDDRLEYQGYTFLSYRVLSSYDNYELSFMTIHFNNGVTSKIIFGKE